MSETQNTQVNKIHKKYVVAKINLTIAMICLRLKGNKAFYSKYEIVSLIYQLEI